MKLEYPLNDALPNTEHARDRLLARMYSFRKHEQLKTGAKDEDFALLYAYGMFQLGYLMYCSWLIETTSFGHWSAIRRDQRGDKGSRELVWCPQRGPTQAAIEIVRLFD